MGRSIAANGPPDVQALRRQILLMQVETHADTLAQFIQESAWIAQLPLVERYGHLMPGLILLMERRDDAKWE